MQFQHIQKTDKIFCLWRILQWYKCVNQKVKLSAQIIHLFINFSALDPLVHGVSHERLGLPINKEAVVHGGLGVITAGVFLAGEMAGSGVLALPYAMTGTGESSQK